jgi:hypothetical protein
MRIAGDPCWTERVRAVEQEAKAAGYIKDTAFAARLLTGDSRPRNVLMFL